jgi:hypothetical protein
VSFALTPKQAEANRLLGSSSAATHIMLRGGSRSGKTFLIVRAICIRAMKAPNSKHAIFRFRFNHAKATIWQDTLPKVMRLCFPTFARPQRDRPGRELPERIADHPGRPGRQGPGREDPRRRVLDDLLQRVSQIPWSSVEVAPCPAWRRTAGSPLKAYFDCNPPSKLHWSYNCSGWA